MHVGKDPRAQTPATMLSYAVAWKENEDPVRMGKLELAGEAIHLEAGTHRDGRILVRHIPYRHLRGAELEPTGRRIANRPTVAVSFVHGVISLAPAGIGAALEVLHTLQQAVTV
jgi:hypothetical protein